MSSLREVGFRRTHAPPRRDASALREALGRLSSVVTDVAVTADASLVRRCPHRGARGRCRYRAPCRNQVSAREAPVCGGDAHLRFQTVASRPSVSPGAEAG
jgi:hypothetical protein